MGLKQNADKRRGNVTLYDQRVELEHLFRTAPIGLCLLDCDLRYIMINEMFASISGKTVEEHLGRTISEMIPDLASKIEHICKRVIKTNESALDLEIHDTAQKIKEKEKYWQTSFHPLRDRDGQAHGVKIVFQDITERKHSEETLEKRLEFERLLATLSAKFVNIPSNEVDKAIERSLQLFIQVLDLDRSSIVEFSQDKKLMHLTHSCAAPNIRPMPTPMVMNERFPWYSEKVLRGETVAISRLDELPVEASLEKKYFLKEGQKSNLVIPLTIGRSFLGGMSFSSFRNEKEWPEELIKRLRLIGEVFANALMRKRKEQELRTALSEIKKLKNNLEAENIYLQEEIRLQSSQGEIIGQSSALKRALMQVENVAGTDSTVLLLGETGTGKELIARAIHKLSSRNDRPMVKVNCATLPSTLIERELFGCEKGAYTGANSKQIGRFELAEGSTIFLDEIGDLPLELQAKLLRVLEQGQFERLGSSKTIKVSVRVIAATNRNLAKAVQVGNFREDLYYRLNVFPISVPPLRERVEDIPILVWAFVSEFRESMGKRAIHIPQKSIDVLKKYPWPGNIRELKNVIERAMIQSKGSILQIDPPKIELSKTYQAMTLEEVEKRHILETLKITKWRVSGEHGAAKILDLNPKTLESRMKKMGIRRPEHSS